MSDHPIPPSVNNAKKTLGFETSLRLGILIGYYRLHNDMEG